MAMAGMPFLMVGSTACTGPLAPTLGMGALALAPGVYGMGGAMCWAWDWVGSLQWLGRMTTNNHGVQGPVPQVNTSPSYLMGEVGMWRHAVHTIPMGTVLQWSSQKYPDHWYSLLSLQGSHSYNHSHIGSGPIINAPGADGGDLWWACAAGSTCLLLHAVVT